MKIPKSYIKWAESLSDDELLSEYFDKVYESLGTEIDLMYERGYDMRDIAERAEYEEAVDKCCDILYSICLSLGLDPWKREKQEH